MQMSAQDEDGNWYNYESHWSEVIVMIIGSPFTWVSAYLVWSLF